MRTRYVNPTLDHHTSARRVSLLSHQLSTTTLPKSEPATDCSLFSFTFQLLDAIEDDLAAGGQIIDYHASEFFPQSKIDLVLVLRAKTETLFDRLKARGYAQNKIDEDMDAEIMEVALQEAREAYDEEIVIELMSDDVDEIEGNVERVKKWVEAWKEKQIDDDAEDDS